MTLTITTLGRATLCIVSLKKCKKGSYECRRSTVILQFVILLRIVMHKVIIPSNTMKSKIMLIVIFKRAVMQSVILLTVVAPFEDDTYHLRCP